MTISFRERVKQIGNREFKVELIIPPTRKMTPAEEERYHKEAKKINQMLCNSEGYKEQ